MGAGIAAERAAVVAEAKTWIGTKWHHAASVKGAGVDCGYFLIKTFAAVGLIPDFSTGYYPSDWALNRRTGRYVEFVRQYATEFPGPPLPGDIVMWRFGLDFSHGAIVVDWPIVIEARRGVGVTMTDVMKDQIYLWDGHPGQEKPRERIYFTLWPSPMASAAEAAAYAYSAASQIPLTPPD